MVISKIRQYLEIVLKGHLRNPKVRKRNVTGSTNTYHLKNDVGKRLGYHAGSQEVGRCHTQKVNLSNHYMQAVKHAGEGIHPGFETDQMPPEVQNLRISSFTKGTDVIQRVVLKKACQWNKNSYWRWWTPWRLRVRYLNRVMICVTGCQDCNRSLRMRYSDVWVPNLLLAQYCAFARPKGVGALMLVWCLGVDRFWNDATLLLCAVHFLLGFCGFRLNCSFVFSADFFQIPLVLFCCCTNRVVLSTPPFVVSFCCCCDPFDDSGTSFKRSLLLGDHLPFPAKYNVKPYWFAFHVPLFSTKKLQKIGGLTKEVLLYLHLNWR